MTDPGTHVSDETIAGTKWRITSHERGNVFRATAPGREPVEAGTIGELLAKIEEQK